ncbi:hypothetical protein OUZ56_012997 [Daphnia magna]|uniref:Uncharacterized protein n=1 Tax=Daphnia magna TaxID=35525 RepID=A0ABQ9Z4M2_9CRUS|nr:hypothetical protein OUZ56_012997 [Daphnia magna]
MSFFASSNATSCSENRSSETSVTTAARVLPDFDSAIFYLFYFTEELSQLRHNRSTFSDEDVLLRPTLLDLGVSPGASVLDFDEDLDDLDDLEDLEDRAGVTGGASGAGVDGPGREGTSGSG